MADARGSGGQRQGRGEGDWTTYLLVTYDGATETLALDAVNAETDWETYERATTAAPTSYSPNPAARMKPLYIGMGAPELGTPQFPFFARIQEVALYKIVLPGDREFQHGLAAGGFPS